ncbi:MAG: putative small secreted protein [Cocleimonas sp.]|jgi:predicted small secreted protein
MKNIILMVLISGLGLLTLNGCSTIEGAGKDIQKAGEAISDKAKRAKKG